MVCVPVPVNETVKAPASVDPVFVQSPARRCCQRVFCTHAAQCDVIIIGRRNIQTWDGLGTGTIECNGAPGNIISSVSSGNVTPSFGHTEFATSGSEITRAGNLGQSIGLHVQNPCGYSQCSGIGDLIPPLAVTVPFVLVLLMVRS